MINKFVLGMVSLRLLSGCLEIIAALIMLRLNQVDRALVINSALALIGPIILLSTTAVGLVGLADKLSLSKISFVFAGVGFILIGILKK